MEIDNLNSKQVQNYSKNKTCYKWGKFNHSAANCSNRTKN